MQSDLELKHKQIAWESPKAIAAIVAATAVIIGTVAGVLGYTIGKSPPAAANLNFPPGTVITIPATPK